MPLKFHWFLPTQGDGRGLIETGDAPPAGVAGGLREASIAYLTRVATAAEDLGFEAALTPTGGWCDDAWVVTAMLSETSEHLNDSFGRLFDEMLKKRTDRLSAEPEDTEVLVEAITLYHMVIEGMLALTGQHFIMSYNENEGTLPGFV